MVCGIWDSETQFWGHFGPPNKSKVGLCLFSQNLFFGFTSVLLHILIASTFRCVENMGLRSPILGSLWSPKLFKIPVFGRFLKKISTGFASVLVYMSIWAIFIGVLNIGHRGPISGSFWTPKYNMIQVFSHFLKIFSAGFTSFLFYMLIGGMFRCISKCISACSRAC